MGSDPRQQFGEAKRLGHIVIGARIEALDRVGFGIAPRQHDDRVLEAFLAQLLDDCATIHVRQTNVHNDKIGCLSVHRLDCALGGVRLDRREFFVQGELLGQGGAQIRVVVRDQDF